MFSRSEYSYDGRLSEEVLSIQKSVISFSSPFSLIFAKYSFYSSVVIDSHSFRRPFGMEARDCEPMEREQSRYVEQENEDPRKICREHSQRNEAKREREKVD